MSDSTDHAAAHESRSLSDSPEAEPPSKKKKYACKFKAAWKTEFPGIIESKRGPEYACAYCRFCTKDISVNHGGKNDIKNHVKTPSHLKAEKAAKTQGTQARLWELRGGAAAGIPFKDKVTTAEALFTQFIAEHNLPFAVGDHLTKLVKKAFPDSEIAKSMSLGHTKVSAIVNEALGPHFKSNNMLKRAQEGPVTIMMDESNKRSDNKACAILIRFLDNATMCVENRFLDMPICNIATAEKLFATLETSLG